MNKVGIFSSLLIALGSAFFVHDCYSEEEVAPTNSIAVESRSKITHEEDVPGLMKKDQIDEQSQTTDKDSLDEKDQKDISLVCYKSGICLVKDRRIVKTHSGLNEVTFQGIDPKVDIESINFRTPKKGKIRVCNFMFHSNNLSRHMLFQNAIGEDVFYQLLQDGRIEKGTLICISEEDGKHYAAIKTEDKCFVLPLEKCVAIAENALKLEEQNSLDLSFEVDETNDIELEISYLTPNVHWKHVCIVDIFEKMDRIDIVSQALIKNDTDYDIENADIVFDTSTPRIDHDEKSKYDEPKEVLNYKRKLSVKRRSDSMCVLKAAKEINPVMEHIIRIPFNVIDGSALKEVEVPVKNLLVVENTTSLGIGADFQDSDEVLLFRRLQGERSFLGKRSLSSIRKGDAFIFEIGNTCDITGNVRLTDSRKLSEKSIENWVRVVVKNDKSVEATVSVVIDVDGSWRVSKENFEMQKSDKPTWSLTLNPNETKELHFRMIIDNK
ncbi:hypothetical protein FACS1894126_2240 [Alphaproteobacteria bacterium]|nr:hypothetical protein FACS1894126_2240 [Alphaproteobacteria bacterium]